MHEPKTRDTLTTNTLTSEARRAKRAESERRKRAEGLRSRRAASGSRRL